MRPGSWGEDRTAWLVALLGYGLLSLIAALTERYHHILGDRLLLFFFCLSILTALIPASGPRGQRVTLLPTVGMAMALLLPPCTATLPLLLANSLYAATRDTPAARRGVLGRGVWLICATLASAMAYRLMQHNGAAQRTLADEMLAAGLYAAVYIAGRQVGVKRIGPRRSVWQRTLLGGRLEAAALIAGIPAVIMMTAVAANDHVVGVAATTGLMALLLVIAGFGFEVGMLREQVRAMEKISAVTLSQPTRAKSSSASCSSAPVWSLVIGRRSG